MSQLNILIVEDDPTIAIDIVLALEAHDYAVLGPTHRADRALEYLQRYRIDLALLDINLAGDVSGIDLAHQINDQFGIPFIFLTSYADKDTIGKAADTFPATYIVKPFKEADLAPAIEMAMAGAVKKYAEFVPSLALINKDLVQGLTKTEYEILLAVDKGLSLAEIAEIRHNSENTIKTHMKNIYSKIAVRNRVEMVNFLRNFR